MTTFNGPDLLENLRWRYAVKKFDATRKVSDADFSILEQALVLAPSSYGLQPWKAIVVRDPELRKKLRAAAWNQSQVEDASHVVIFTAKKKITEEDVAHFIKLTGDTRHLPAGALDGYKATMVGDLVNGPRAAWVDQWTARQAYIALGVLLTTAANLHIDACPMEGVRPAELRRDPRHPEQRLPLRGHGDRGVSRSG